MKKLPAHQTKPKINNLPPAVNFREADGGTMKKLPAEKVTCKSQVTIRARCVYTYIYIYMYTYICIYIYVYTVYVYVYTSMTMHK